MREQYPISSAPSHEAISQQLELMLASSDFVATPQQIALLKFVVGRAQEGAADSIKGYTVATEVFGRRSDFDQSIDPIVSIQASRLRRALEQYYETTGKNDPIRIDIPKGGYVPTFIEQCPIDQPIAAEKAATPQVIQAWPTLLIRPPANLTTNPEDDYLAIGLTVELAHALGHYPEIRILEARHQKQKSTALQTDIDFVIDGNVRRDSTGIKVTISLSDVKKGIQIWSGKYHGDLEAAKMISLQEQVAAEVAVRMAGGNSLIPRHLSGVSKSKVIPDLTTYEAMLRYWEYDTLRTRKSYLRAYRALEHAVDREPGCGQIWSMLAAQYASNYGLEYVNLSTPIEKAEEYAWKGISLEPTNRFARIVLAYVRLLENKLGEARREAETAYNLCPNSLMVLDTIGWVMALAGDWERGISWIEKAIKLNPYYRFWVRHALSINWFRVGNYEKAYQASLDFAMPESHWDQLLKASACGHLERIEEGNECVRALQEIKPDFAKRGCTLIERYIKFPDIADRIIEGLGRLEMNLDS